MEENTQEKNLVEKKEGIFGKIKNFFKGLFRKNTAIEEAEEQTVNTVKENEFKETIKKIDDEDTKLLELQRRYRRGEVAESDLTEQQIDDLSELYDRQIEELKKSIELKEQKIAEYKKRKQPKVEENHAL